MTRFAARIMAQRAKRAVDERGVTMVIFGLVIVALLIIVAIVIDLGNARQQKRDVQNAADAAALAGAGDINTANNNPCGIAVNYVWNNLRLGTVQGSCNAAGSYSWPTSGTISGYTMAVQSPYSQQGLNFDSASLVNVRACKDVATSFARIIGVTSLHVCGNATAHKVGASSPPGVPGGSDLDSPCTEDNFIPTKYMPGGSPGNNVAPGNTVGAWFGTTDSSTLDQTTRVPTVVFQQGSTQTTYTPSSATNPVVLTSKGNTTVKVNGVNVTYQHVVQITWKIPDKATLADDTAYSVHLSAYDNDQDNSPNGDCGKVQWAFTLGTVAPPGGVPVCGENSFIGTIKPPAGTTVKPGDHITVQYQDESPIYNPPANLNDPNAILFAIDYKTANERDLPQADLVTPPPSTFGPNTDPSSANSTDHYTLVSPSSTAHKEKYSTDINFVVPNLANGTHSFHLQAYDSDNNKPGGDCGIVDWSLNVTGGRSDVELVQ